MIKQIILVGFGGALGSILRYVTSLLILKYYSNALPLATFAVNVMGCFLAGLLIGLIGQNIQVNQTLRLLFITGFCGGYTTFSAFASENIYLLQSGKPLSAVFYIAVSVLTGLLAVWVGLALSKI